MNSQDTRNTKPSTNLDLLLWQMMIAMSMEMIIIMILSSFLFKMQMILDFMFGCFVHAACDKEVRKMEVGGRAQLFLKHNKGWLLAK